MPYLLSLADVCQSSGLHVAVIPGWESRGHGPMSSVRTVVTHHTAGPADGEYPSLAVVRDGRPGLPGPLSQLGLGRSGTVYVIAAGLSYHAGIVRDPLYGNAYSIGIEAESTGYGDWTPEQRDAYPRLCAALCRHYGLAPDRVLAHREVCYPPGRKPDPTGIDMDDLRATVARLLAGHDPSGDPDQPAPPEETEDEMATEMRVRLDPDNPARSWPLNVEGCNRITVAWTGDIAAEITEWTHADGAPFKPESWAAYYEDNRLTFRTRGDGSSPLREGVRMITVGRVLGAGELHVRAYKAAA